MRRFISITRRVLYFGGIIVAMSLALWTDFEPMFRLKIPDFGAQQKRIIVFDEEDRTEHNQPIEQYITQVTSGKTIERSGDEWRSIFDNAIESQRRGQAVPEWSRRVAPAFSANSGFFFEEAEEPLSELRRRIPHGETAYLTHRELPGVYLRVFHIPEYEIVGVGDGPVDERPPSFVYPHGTAALWVALIGVAAFVLLPWPRRNPNMVDDEVRTIPAFFPPWR